MEAVDRTVWMNTMLHPTYGRNSDLVFAPRCTLLHALSSPLIHDQDAVRHRPFIESEEWLFFLNAG